MKVRCLGAAVALSGLLAMPAHATSMVGAQASDRAPAQAILSHDEGDAGADPDVTAPAKFGGVPIVIGSAPAKPANAPGAATPAPVPARPAPTPAASAPAPEEAPPREAKDVPGPSALLLFGIGVAGLLIGRRIRSARPD